MTVSVCPSVCVCPRPYLRKDTSDLYQILCVLPIGWRRGVVVCGVRRMNEVNARRARLVPGWVTVFGPGGYTISVCKSQLGQLSLAPLRGRLIEYQLRLGKGGNVTSAGWQVTLCDPMWHVSSRSGLATLRTAIHLLLTYLLTMAVARSSSGSVAIRYVLPFLWMTSCLRIS